MSNITTLVTLAYATACPTLRLWVIANYKARMRLYVCSASVLALGDVGNTVQRVTDFYK